MELPVIKFSDGTTTEKTKISDLVVTQKFNEPLVHQVVIAYLAKKRSGNHSQKSRSEVRGGGRKPWRQKGTGRARAGTIRSPIWTGGGVTFAAKPRDYSQKVNKKMYRSAIRSILSELVRKDRLLVIDSLNVDSGKTKQLADKLDKLNLRNVLLVGDSVSENLYLASRNLRNICVLDMDAVDPVSLVSFDKVAITKVALEHIEERL